MHVVVEHQVLVHLVGDGDDVVLLAEVGDQLQLVVVEHLPGRVVGRVEQHEAGLGVERPPQLIGIEAEAKSLAVRSWFGTKENAAHPRPSHRDPGSVGVIRRIERNDLVAGLTKCEQGGGQRLGRTGGDEDLRGRIELEIPEPSLMFADRQSEVLGAGTGRVLVHPGANCSDRRLGHLGGPIGVGKPLAEVDRTGLGRQRRHLGEDRRAESLEAAGEKW